MLPDAASPRPVNALRRWTESTLAGLMLAVLLAGHAGGAWHLAPVRQLDAAWHDLRLRAFAREKEDERVAVIDIDERSLAELGRWPWSRSRLAEVIRLLFEREQVSLVGLDLILAEPELSAGLDVLRDLAQGSLRDNKAFQAQLPDLRDALDHDGQLAAVLARYPVVLGFHLNPDEAEATRNGQLPLPLGDAAAWGGLPRYTGYGANLPRFMGPAQSAGFLDAWVDPDGLRRRAPLLVDIDGQAHGSLALALGRQYLGARLAGEPAGPRRQPLDIQALQHHGRPAAITLVGNSASLRLAMSSDGSIVLPYARASGLARSHAAVDLLRGKLPAGALKGRIVLISTTVPGLGDRHPTPVSASLPGVQGHATLLSALLDGRVPHAPAGSRWGEVGLIGALWLGLAWALARASLRLAALLACVTISSLLVFNAWAWAGPAWALPAAGPVLLVLGLWAWRVLHGHIVETRERHRIEGLFGQYVPPELVQRMSRNPAHYDMQGRSAELTVLFADLSGFTRLSESMPAAELAALMNDFFSDMTDIVREHGGTLDKYIGDSVMAFWGAPVYDPQHALHAVQAAQAMLRRLPVLNARFAARGWPLLSVGIGINSGSMVVGDLGSRHRRAYTVLGDAVNVAARLQNLTARLGSPILLGEGTAARLPAGLCRELGIEQLRGRTSPVTLYTPTQAAAES